MYYIVYGFFYLLSFLPFRVLYFISDGLFLLAYYVIKYRREVVEKNLEIAFPEKTEEERKIISKKFYRNFTDYIVETIKLIRLSRKNLNKRFKGNWEVIGEIAKNGKSVQVHLGHNFNWEWGNSAFGANSPLVFLGVYKPVKSKVFERLMVKIRTRTGTKLLRSSNMKEDFLPYRNHHYTLALVADQNPRGFKNATWINFFGRPAPFVNGPAKNAIANDLNIVFAFISKVKRGYYEIKLTPFTDNAADYTIQQLTKEYVIYLENVIRNNEDMWLWSHRRWRRDWKEEYGPLVQ